MCIGNFFYSTVLFFCFSFLLAESNDSVSVDGKCIIVKVPYSNIASPILLQTIVKNGVLRKDIPVTGNENN